MQMGTCQLGNMHTCLRLTLQIWQVVESGSTSTSISISSISVLSKPSSSSTISFTEFEEIRLPRKNSLKYAPVSICSLFMNGANLDLSFIQYRSRAAIYIGGHNNGSGLIHIILIRIGVGVARCRHVSRWLQLDELVFGGPKHIPNRDLVVFLSVMNITPRLRP